METLFASRWGFAVPGLHPHRLGLLSEENAKAFLLDLCPRIGELASRLARACAYLPLALRIAGSITNACTAMPSVVPTPSTSTCASVIRTGLRVSSPGSSA